MPSVVLSAADAGGAGYEDRDNLGAMAELMARIEAMHLKAAVIPEGERKALSLEYPTSEMSCVLEVDDQGAAARATLLRIARKLMDGTVFP